MLIAVCALATIGLLPTAPPDAYRILFLGNSHTAMQDVPGMVKGLLEADGNSVSTRLFSGALLDDLSNSSDVMDAIDQGDWTHVVLQGAQLSSSHKFEHTKQPAIDLCRRIAKAGAIPLLFAEHPRKGWDEAAWIMDQYRQIQHAYESGRNWTKPTGSAAVKRAANPKAKVEIAPVPMAFLAAIKTQPEIELWTMDGNHANKAGGYLSACILARCIAGKGTTLNFVPKGLSQTQAKALGLIARKVPLKP